MVESDDAFREQIVAVRHIRVVMLSPGGSAERARGLDLGANDVQLFRPSDFWCHRFSGIRISIS